MKPAKKPSREIYDFRATRKSKVDMHHADGHGWAVSYADLLMVLLSFFILYFNFSETTGVGDAKETKLAKIIVDAKKLGSTELASTTDALKGEGAGAGTSKHEIQKLAFAELAKIPGLRLTEKEDHFVIDIENGAFGSGEYKLSKAIELNVDAVLAILKLHGDQVAITVIGHADKTPLRYRNDLLSDNFDLSSVRALTVLKYMFKHGFPANRGSARAASSYDRAARSVSIEVRLAEVKPGVNS